MNHIYYISDMRSFTVNRFMLNLISSILSVCFCTVKAVRQQRSVLMLKPDPVADCGGGAQ